MLAGSVRFQVCLNPSWVIGLVWLCGCATGQMPSSGETPSSPRSLPPEDLVCERDEDCGIVSDDVDSCRSDPVEPYAIAHAAAHRHRTQHDCSGDDTLQLYESCHTSPKDWIAVCSRHVCKRRAVRSLTKVGCRP